MIIRNTSSGKIIHIYDGLFSYIERMNYFDFVSKSRYLITGSDNNYDLKNQIYSRYSEEDLINLGITNTNSFKMLEREYNLSSRNIKQIRVNCSHPSELTNPHTDREGITILYYANPEWELNWLGHTIFLNEEMDEIEYTCIYKPGRLVVFDGTIPHMVMTPNTQSRMNRLTFVIQYGEVCK